MTRVAILTGAVEVGTVGSSAQSALEAFQRNPEGFDLVVYSSQAAVLGGSLVGHVVSITRQTVGPLGLINVATNTFAGSVTLLKIVIDIKNDYKIQKDDILNLVSNISGVVGTFAIMAIGGTFSAPIGATMVAVGMLTVIGNINWKNVTDGIWHGVIKPIWEKYYSDQPSANYNNSWIAPDLSVRTYSEIIHNYRGQIPTIEIDFESGSNIILPIVIPQSITDSGGIPFGGGATYRVHGGWETGNLLPPGRVEVGPITYDAGDTYNQPEADADYYSCH